MKFLREQLDKIEPHFVGEGKFKKFYPIYEMIDTFVYTPGEVTENTQTHIRDGLDLKRMMISVAIALTPCILMAMYNTGYQATNYIQLHKISPHGWRYDLLALFGLPLSSPNFLCNIVLNFIHGALYFVPIFLVCNIAGGVVETIFSVVRKHEINEGFLVTGLLFPLTVPPTTPLWQVALAIIFAVLFGKEIFGGTGKNFLNVALLARAFLYFAYPAQISGDAVWVAVDGHTMATPLGQVALGGMNAVTVSWSDAFLGLIPGSMGETSVLACLIGAGYLLVTGIGSWRTMLFVFIGMMATTSIFYLIGSETNLAFSMPPHWHLVVGGFAFGLVFMATDPVTSALTDQGKMYYGLLIGFMTALIRVINPAFPEGIMLAILFANVFAPLIDWFVLNANIERRRRRTNVG